MNDRLTGARPACFPETQTGSKPRFEPVTVSGRSIRPPAESTRNRSFLGRASITLVFRQKFKSLACSVNDAPGLVGAARRAGP